MKTTSQRIQRILSILNKAALVLCGILFVWQGVVGVFFERSHYKSISRNQ
jgi:hypothetical protein